MRSSIVNSQWKMYRVRLCCKTFRYKNLLENKICCKVNYTSHTLCLRQRQRNLILDHVSQQKHWISGEYLIMWLPLGSDWFYHTLISYCCVNSFLRGLIKTDYQRSVAMLENHLKMNEDTSRYIFNLKLSETISR